MKPKQRYERTRALLPGENFVGHVGVWDAWIWRSETAPWLHFIGPNDVSISFWADESMDFQEIPVEIIAYVRLKYGA